MKEYKTWRKVLAFIGSILFGAILVGTIIGIAVCFDGELYSTPKEKIMEDVMQSQAYSECNTIYEYVVRVGNEDYIKGRLNYTNIVRAEVVELDKDGKESREVWSYSRSDSTENQYEYTMFYSAFSEDGYIIDQNFETVLKEGAEDICRISVYIDKAVPVQDTISLLCFGVELLYIMRYPFFAIALLSFFLLLFCLIRLFCMVGRSSKDADARLNWEAKIPLGIQIILYMAVGAAICGLMVELSYYSENLYWAVLIAVVALCLLLAMLCLYWLVSLAIRIKTRTLWKNTILYRLFRGLGTITKNIHLIWKMAIGVVVFLVLQLIVLAVGFESGDPDVGVFFSVVLDILAGALLCYGAILLQKINQAGQKLAEGDLNYKIDTSKMFGTIKKHAENMNCISVGMGYAVEEQLKSERMKTELITNVSHDIKTPLTSIINYSDLIGKEECDNPKIAEYAEVLNRQSTKLKRLIEDLVEASKASTGNLEVVMAPCAAEIFVDQAGGEYEDKLKAAQLTLVTKVPEFPVQIMADSRRMWRIFDNLLGNACKYAQTGTRVYLSLEVEKQNAVFSFKNTSSAALDLKPEELMERFVRGDKSRNTEGNGLGLAIAKSLVELQGGTMGIYTDGDLFKVLIRFPIIPTQ